VTDDSHPPPQGGKGSGCLLGGLAVLGSVAFGGALSGILAWLLSQANVYGPVAGITVLLPLGLLVFATIYWRKVPGFLLGVALTIGITVVIFGACTAILVSQSG
jgi:hypothetical protein